MNIEDESLAIPLSNNSNPRFLRDELLARNDRIFAKGDHLSSADARIVDSNLEKIRAINDELENTTQTHSGVRIASGPFRSLGEQLTAIVRSARTGKVDARLHQIREIEERQLGLSESIPSQGGFMIQPTFSSELLTNAFETGILASRVRTIPLGANSNGLKINAINETSRADGSRWGGIRAYWLDEGATKTKSKPAFRQMNLTLNKLIGLVYATDELVEDATALEAVIREGFGQEFGFQLDAAIFSGDGSGKPQGFTGSNALITVNKETGQAANTVVFENITKMYARMWPPSAQRAVWLANIETFPQLASMSIPVGTGGVPVWQPANQVAGRPFSELMGRPLIFVEQASALGTKNDLVFVDLSQYLLVQKSLQSAASIHVQFVTDETTFRFVLRVDGQPIWSSALTPFKGASTLSPYVTLQTRS
ncbi:phage major capsid protein [Acidobacteria bacterium AH-259-A15]|nr:phage major capsid protein [Acidobacteria bacterium AH-259-A15]